MNDDERWDRAETAVRRAEEAVVRAELAVGRAEGAVADQIARAAGETQTLNQIRRYVIGKLCLDLLIFIVLIVGWQTLLAVRDDSTDVQRNIATFNANHERTQRLICNLDRQLHLVLPADCEGR